MINSAAILNFKLPKKGDESIFGPPRQLVEVLTIVKGVCEYESLIFGFVLRFCATRFCQFETDFRRALERPFHENYD